MQGDEKLTDTAQQGIIDATDDYYEAQKNNDKEGMEAAHQRAEDIRNNPANQASNNSGSSSGNSSDDSSDSSSSSSSSSSKDLFYALTNAVLSQGYFNSDTWSAVSAFYPRKNTNNVSEYPGKVYASAGNIGGFDLNISNDLTKDQWTKIGYYALGYLNYSIDLNKQVKELQGQFNPYEKLKEGIDFWKSAYTLGDILYSGDITTGDLAMMLGEQAVDSMVGGILYVKDNYYLMTNGVETTKNSVFMLGYNSGRAITELAAIGVGLKEVSTLVKNWGTIKLIVPRGFSNGRQVLQCTSELKQALSSSGLDVKSIYVRGSSATGVSSKGGSFRIEAQNGLKPSDIDVAIELNKPIENITTSKNQPGFIHPNKMMKNYPELQAWSEKWSDILGRDITPGGWQPGTFNDPNTIKLK